MLTSLGVESLRSELERWFSWFLFLISRIFLFWINAAAVAKNVDGDIADDEFDAKSVILEKSRGKIKFPVPKW